MKKRIVCNHKFEIDNETIWNVSISEIVVDTDKKTITGCCNNEKGDIIFIIDYKTNFVLIVIGKYEIMNYDIKDCNFRLSNGANNPYMDCNNWEDILDFIKENNHKNFVIVKNIAKIWDELELLEKEDVDLYGNVKINIKTGEIMIIYFKTEKDLKVGEEWILVNNYKTRPNFIEFRNDIINALKNCDKISRVGLQTIVSYNF